MKKGVLELRYKSNAKWAILAVLNALVALAPLSCGTNDDAAESTGIFSEMTFSSQSQFLKELEKENYQEVAAPETPPVFLWDFSEKEMHSYAYRQEVRSRSSMGPNSGGTGATGQAMSAKGELVVNSKGDHTANLVLRDMKTRMKIELPKAKGVKTLEHTAPPIAMQGMKENGSVSIGNSAQERLLKMLFPLPPKSMNVGESMDVPTQTPFNAMGSLLEVKGRSRITLKKYVKVGNQICAVFDTDIDVSQLEIPSELKGDYCYSEKGRSVFYFDIEDRRFVSGTIALLLQFSIDAPMPQMRVDGKEAPDMPKSTQMEMVSDNLIQIGLRE